MSRTGWKQFERDVAALLGGQRFPANTGGRLDIETEDCVVQCKHRRNLSLAQIEALALEMTEAGRAKGKVGLVAVKRSAGRGQETPILFVLVADGGANGD